MRATAVVILVGGILALLAIVALLAPYLWRRRGGAAPERTIIAPMSNVEVLTTAEEMESAAHRAAQFERAAAASATERAKHYEEMADQFGDHDESLHALPDVPSNQDKRSA